MKHAFIVLTLISGSTLLIADNSWAAPGVSSWNRNCIKFYKEWQKKPKHRAFAVSRATGQESCGGTWGAPSKKAAEEGARKWCSKGSVDGANCRVTASE